jgi:hypothetical protein
MFQRAHCYNAIDRTAGDHVHIMSIGNEIDTSPAEHVDADNICVRRWRAIGRRYPRFLRADIKNRGLGRQQRVQVEIKFAAQIVRRRRLRGPVVDTL